MMGWEKYLVLAVLAGMLFLLYRTHFKPALIFLGGLAFFHIIGWIDAARMLRGFTNPALVTLIMLMVVARPLENSQFLKKLVGLLVRPDSLRLSYLRLSVVILPFSAFLNNTAVVASLLPVLRNNRHYNASRLLMPLSYLAIIGGTLTLVGTSTNLILNSFVLAAGLPELEMFSFALVGLPLAGLGILYIVFTGPWLFPDRRQVAVAGESFFLEARVEPDSTLAGKTIQENGLRKLENLFLAEILRGDRLLSPVAPYETIRPGDVLIFTGNMENIQEIFTFNGLKIFEEEQGSLQENLVEVVLSHRSYLVGKRIREAFFRSEFDAAVVAVSRGDKKLSGKIGDIMLRAGDRILLATSPDFGRRIDLSQHFYFTQEIAAIPRANPRQEALILGSFLVVLLLSGFHVLPLFTGLLLLIMLFTATKVWDAREVRQNLPVPLYAFIGSALGISEVMVSTGTADWLAAGLLAGLSPLGLYGVMAGIYLTTLLLTEFISNGAAAALVFPLATACATGLNIEPLPLIMAIAYAASASYVTPFGYQTNLIVFGPGRYRLADYWKAGGALSVLQAILVLGLIPVFFPFQAVGAAG